MSKSGHSMSFHIPSLCIGFYLVMHDPTNGTKESGAANIVLYAKECTTEQEVLVGSLFFI